MAASTPPALFETHLLPDDVAEFYRDLLGFVSGGKTGLGHYVTDRPSPAIVASYLTKKDLNAGASPQPSGFAVDINAALPCLLGFYFNNVFRTQEYLPHIGRVDRETHYRGFESGIPLMLPAEVPIYEAVPIILGTSRPRDDDRAAAAMGMARIATSFCMYHEVAHVYLGHALANVELFGETGLLEFSAPHGHSTSREAATRRREKAKMRRVWEYEADHIATNVLVADMLNPANAAHLNDLFRLDPEEPTDLIGVAMAAIYGLFHLMGQRQDRIDALAYYPDPLVRFGALISHVATGLPDMPRSPIQDSELFRVVLLQAVSNTHNAWTELGLPYRDVTAVSTWNEIMDRVDEIEADRLQLHEAYALKSWFYPFTR